MISLLIFNQQDKHGSCFMCGHVNIIYKNMYGHKIVTSSFVWGLQDHNLYKFHVICAPTYILLPRPKWFEIAWKVCVQNYKYLNSWPSNAILVLVMAFHLTMLSHLKMSSAYNGSYFNCSGLNVFCGTARCLLLSSVNFLLKCWFREPFKIKCWRLDKMAAILQMAFSI